MTAVSPPLVLIVDDDIGDLDAMQAFLESSGYRIARALDGREALRLIHALHPAAVVLDLMLPVLSGGRVLATLRSEHSEVPVILVSGVVAAPAIWAQHDFLPKPCEPTALRAAVERAVARSAHA
ncbi:MAG TPA: response regulator [Polyangia bacterium]|nr:response regulator [Polyangia bacterium]